MSKNWLESLKAGDRVIVIGRHRDGRSIRQVSRTTATRVMLNVGGTVDMAFRVRDGGEVGGGGGMYGGMQLQEGTPEAIGAVLRKNRRANLARALGHRNWENVSLEVLEAITLLLSKPPKDV